MNKVLILLVIFFVGCSSVPRFYTDKVTENREKESRIFASQVKEMDTLISLPGVVETVVGDASFYADAFDGKTTANGETYNMYELTAAHRIYPFNTLIRVVNLANNKTVIVRINDRGPVPKDRIIDLSLGAAIQLEMEQTGIQRVRLEIIEWGIK